MTAQYEGHEVTKFEAKLPAMTVEAPESYQYNQTLRLALEVRVKGVEFQENREGYLTKLHKLAIEDIQVVAAFDPSEDLTVVGGTASGRRLPDEDAEDLGVQFLRTSDIWPDGLAQA